MTREEAIEIIKRNCTSGSDLRKACELFIPELTENEDERIRKWLIEMVEELRKANPTNAEHNGNCSEAIAYLEKQKELPTNEEMLRTLRVEYEKGVADTIAKYEQREQKSAEWAELQSEFRNINEAFEDGKKEVVAHPERYGLCGPTEWSEDNIKELTEFEAAMLHIGMSFFGGSAGLNPNDTNEVKKQAKILLELVPKQEWSDEDESQLDDIEKAISITYDLNHAPQYHYWLEEKLQSLRSQPQQEWCEEDKKKISKLKTFITQEWFNKENRNKALDMIDALRPQPKQEWSEEDEKMLTDISWAIRHCAYNDKKKERVMKWFNDDYRKFLRPQIIDSKPLYTIEQVHEKIREAQEWSEEQKEQKPELEQTLEFEKAKAKYEGIVEGKQTVIDNSEEYGLYKPTEWSEYDRGVLGDAIAAVDLLGNDESFNKSNPNLAKAFRVAKDWLKSLPERFNVKEKKQEWTKEDEDMLLKLLMMIDTANDYEEIRVWLCTKLKVVTSTELDRKLESDMTQLERYISEARAKKGFYWNNKEVSWEEIPLEERKHDYPYYFKNGLDCYPFRCLDDEGICIKID